MNITDLKSKQQGIHSFLDGYIKMKREGQIEGGRKGQTWCGAVYCWRDSHPTYLISLFVIKNYSQADIINLPTQPYSLNGPLQTSEKKWACASCASSRFTLYYSQLLHQDHKGCLKVRSLTGAANCPEKETGRGLKEDIRHLSAISVESIALSPPPSAVTIYNPFLCSLIWLRSRSQASPCEITNIWRVIYSQAVTLNPAAERAAGQPPGNLLMVYPSLPPAQPDASSLQ